MAIKGWRRLRVVVELPVRGELANEKRLAQALASILSKESERLLKQIDGAVGKFRVIQFNRLRKPQAKNPEKALQEILDGLARRIQELERTTNPHHNSPAGQL